MGHRDLLVTHNYLSQKSGLPISPTRQRPPRQRLRSDALPRSNCCKQRVHAAPARPSRRSSPPPARPPLVARRTPLVASHITYQLVVLTRTLRGGPVFSVLCTTPLRRLTCPLQAAILGAQKANLRGYPPPPPL